MQIPATGFHIHYRSHLNTFGHLSGLHAIFFHNDINMIANFGIIKFVPGVNYFITISTNAGKIKGA
jgi:hypothetical protein